jgi:hypothetical protein
LIASWTALPGVTSYKIYYRSLLLGYNWSTKVVSGTTDTLKPLFASHAYVVQVAAFGCPAAGVEGDKSAQVFGVAPAPSTCSPTPTITATSNCPNQITVGFVSGTSPNVRVTLRRLTPSFTTGVNYNVSSGAPVNFNIGTQYAGSVWEVFVRSICPGQTGNNYYSPVSNIVYVTVKPACPPIQNLVLSAADCFGFTAAWNSDNCNNAIPAPYYVLYIKKSTQANYTAYNVGTVNFKDVTWLAPAEYNVFVRSVACNGAVSPNSNVETIVTGGPGCRSEQGDAEALQPNEGGGAGSVTVYPNPASGDFFVDIARSAKGEAAVQIELVNALGQVVQTDLGVMDGAHQNYLVKVTGNVSDGVYFVRVRVDGNVFTQRLVIQKH